MSVRVRVVRVVRGAFVGPRACAHEEVTYVPLGLFLVFCVSAYLQWVRIVAYDVLSIQLIPQHTVRAGRQVARQTEQE